MFFLLGWADLRQDFKEVLPDLFRVIAVGLADEVDFFCFKCPFLRYKRLYLRMTASADSCKDSRLYSLSAANLKKLCDDFFSLIDPDICLCHQEYGEEFAFMKVKITAEQYSSLVRENTELKTQVKDLQEDLLAVQSQLNWLKNQLFGWSYPSRCRIPADNPECRHGRYRCTPSTSPSIFLASRRPFSAPLL